MKNSLVAVTMLFLLTGCTSGSWWQAKFLSSADTKQAIALEESQAPKRCTWVKGNGSAMGVDGYVEVLASRGKGVKMDECASFFNKQSVPIKLSP